MEKKNTLTNKTANFCYFTIKIKSYDTLAFMKFQKYGTIKTGLSVFRAKNLQVQQKISLTCDENKSYKIFFGVPRLAYLKLHLNQITSNLGSQWGCNTILYLYFFKATLTMLKF